jgi:hypothetical protein
MEWNEGDAQAKRRRRTTQTDKARSRQIHTNKAHFSRSVAQTQWLRKCESPIQITSAIVLFFEIIDVICNHIYFFRQAYNLSSALYKL